MYYCFNTIKLKGHSNPPQIPFSENVYTGMDKSSVIRQKGESQNECFKKTKHAKFFEKRPFLTPWYANVRDQRDLVAKFTVCECNATCFIMSIVLFLFYINYHKHNDYHYHIYLFPNLICTSNA